MFRKIFLAFVLCLALSVPAFATISSTTSRMDYTGNGAVHSYSYNFRIFANTDLLVTVRNTSDVETTLTLTTDYTVTGVGSSSGTVVLVNSSQAWVDGDGDLKTGYILTIRRVRPLKQLTDIRNQGAFYPEVHEDAFDSLVMIAQQHQDEIDRSMKLPETIDPDDFDTELPADLAANPGSSIVVNDDGDGFTAGPTADAISAAQANATAAAASATSAASSATSATASATAAAASAATVSLPSITGNGLKILQANAGGTSLQYMDLRAPNVGIGTTTPNAGKFTTLEATSTLTIVNTNATGGYTQSGSSINKFNGNVGIGTAAPVQALEVIGSVKASGAFIGAVTGAVTGNVTGDVTGNLTGNVTGNVTGNLTGNVTGGTFTGSLGTSSCSTHSMSNGETYNIPNGCYMRGVTRGGGGEIDVVNYCCP